MSFDLAIINSDLNLLPNGDIKTVSDTEKLRQDVLKIILTPLGSNIFHSWYGCPITDNVIGKNLPDNITSLEIQSTITDSLERLKALQIQQSTSQNVSLAELINIVGEVVVARSNEDLRQLRIDIAIHTRRLTVIQETFTLII